MKKKLDTDQITNELKGQSLYFEAQSKRLSKKSANKDAKARTGERTNTRTDERANARTSERPNARTVERTNTRTAERVNARTTARKNARRIITRHSYQFYTDQIEDMKSLWRSYQARGIDVDLAHFAREAFDEYLTRIKEKANVTANARTDEHANGRTGEHTNRRTHERTNARTRKRAA